MSRHLQRRVLIYFYYIKWGFITERVCQFCLVQIKIQESRLKLAIKEIVTDVNYIKWKFGHILKQKNPVKLALILSILVTYSLANNTYEIKEQDLITEIENKVPELEKYIEDQKKKITKKIENYSGEQLSSAFTNKVKYIDPSYTLDRDIPKYNQFGQKNGILYKKGYKFNPIDYMKTLPPDFIVFNVCNENEREYVKGLIKEYESKVKDYVLVNSGCKNIDVKKTDFKGKVYFLTQQMKNKFKLEHTISVVYIDKDKKRITVKEIIADVKKDSN